MYRWKMHDFLIFISTFIPSFFIGFFGTFWAVWGITTIVRARSPGVKSA